MIAWVLTRFNYRRIANVISQTSPDMTLQELDSVTVRNKGIHALGELEKPTGMHGTYAAAIPFQVEKLRHRNPLQRDTHTIQNHSNAQTGRKTYPHYYRILKIMYFVPHTSPSLQKTSSLPYH